MFRETHPILGTRDIQRAIAFYTQRLGFKMAFGDKADAPNYVGFRRDAVELHMQFQFEHEMGTIRLRFLVNDPDALFSEYRHRGVECNPNSVHDTSWGTREFALYDLDTPSISDSSWPFETKAIHRTTLGFAVTTSSSTCSFSSSM